MPNSSLPAALRAGTADQHRDLERDLDLPDRITSREDLADVLAGLLASWQPLEHHLSECDWSTLRLDPRLGEAAEMIRADLVALGRPPHPRGSSPPLTIPFDTPARAVGGRYVLLGSALGGSILAPTIERRLGMAPGHATQFFRRSGTDPGQHWHDFRATITATSWSADDVEQSTLAARDTFAFIGAAAAQLGRGPTVGHASG